MNIEETIQSAVAKAVETLYGTAIDPSLAQPQKTKQPSRHFEIIIQ